MDDKRLKALKEYQGCSAEAQVSALRHEMLRQVMYLKGVSVVLNALDISQISGSGIRNDELENYIKRIDEIAGDMMDAIEVITGPFGEEFIA